MQLTHPPAPRSISLNGSGSSPNGSSPHAIAEINAYIAIRDGLLEEAGDRPTAEKLDSVAIANEFVEKCLRSRQPFYHAQDLPAAAAVREGKRCETAKQRIAALIAKVAVSR